MQAAVRFVGDCEFDNAIFQHLRHQIIKVTHHFAHTGARLVGPAEFLMKKPAVRAAIEYQDSGSLIKYCNSLITVILFYINSCLAVCGGMSNKKLSELIACLGDSKANVQ